MWKGAVAINTDGVHIGKGAVVSAGAAVMKFVPVRTVFTCGSAKPANKIMPSKNQAKNRHSLMNW